MKRSLPVLDSIEVAAPCPARWAGMTGDHERRFCEECGKDVHNLSAMPRRQAEAIARDGGCCVRFVRDRRGRVVTADGLLARWFPKVWAGLAALLLGGCRTATMGMIPDDYQSAVQATIPGADPSAGEATKKQPGTPSAQPASRPPG